MGTESKEYIQALKVVYTGPAPGFRVLDASERWRLGNFSSVHEGCFRNLCEAGMGLVQVVSSGSHQLREKRRGKTRAFCLFPFFICCFCFGPLSQRILRHGP